MRLNPGILISELFLPKYRQKHKHTYTRTYIHQFWLSCSVVSDTVQMVKGGWMDEQSQPDIIPRKLREAILLVDFQTLICEALQRPANLIDFQTGLNLSLEQTWGYGWGRSLSLVGLKLLLRKLTSFFFFWLRYSWCTRLVSGVQRRSFAYFLQIIPFVNLTKY